MSSHFSAELRRSVDERAGGACEYCLIQQRDTYFGCHVDHIIAEKHGGPTELDNLALACAVCNRAKGTDIASLVPGTDLLVRLFNPRLDRWDAHFRVDPDTFEIKSLTEIGAATARLLGFNEIERVLERQSLARIGRYSVTRARPK
ncbi:MAG: HNH endonuclease [Pirellulales bacterium]